MIFSALPRPVNVSLAAYPGLQFHDAMDCIARCSPIEPLLGVLGIDETQLCPQNRGVLTLDYADMLRELYPATRFRLHANVRVLPDRHVSDWSNWRADSAYWRALAAVSKRLDAPAYTAHAGRRSESDLPTLFENVRRATDQFGCDVGIEGHFPTVHDAFLISTWEEYRQLFESGVGYALDLSHLHILAEQSRRRELTLVQEMLACERCLEVHLSGNDGCLDQHHMLVDAPWWWSATGYIHDAATVFSEGKQRFPIQMKA
jgi:hypothetical protein